MKLQPSVKFNSRPRNVPHEPFIIFTGANYLSLFFLLKSFFQIQKDEIPNYSLRAWDPKSLRFQLQENLTSTDDLRPAPKQTHQAENERTEKYSHVFCIEQSITNHGRFHFRWICWKFESILKNSTFTNYQIATRSFPLGSYRSGDRQSFALSFGSISLMIILRACQGKRKLLQPFHTLKVCSGIQNVRPEIILGASNAVPSALSL